MGGGVVSGAGAGAGGGGAGAGGGVSGGSGGGGGPSGQESGNAGGDPLSLLFLVQASAITGKLSDMPDTYVDGFAGSFSMFNLQLSPPRWAKSTVNGRRLMDWEEKISSVKPKIGPEDNKRFFSAYAFGDDKTRATEALRFHLFYAVPIFIGTVIFHFLFVQVS